MNPLNKNICERCGTAMNHLADFGSNEDGTVNTEYCHSCYLRGVFVDHGITLEEKIEKETYDTSQKLVEN